MYQVGQWFRVKEYLKEGYSFLLQLGVKEGDYFCVYQLGNPDRNRHDQWLYVKNKKNQTISTNPKIHNWLEPIIDPEEIALLVLGE